jgi:hypothetical protein
MEQKFSVVAIPTVAANAVRATGRAPRYGHPTHTDMAAGFGPCRHCLKTFRVGQEERILFTWDPFSGLAQIPLPGPVFIHAEPCDRYPEAAGYPAELKAYPVLMSAFEKGQTLVAKEMVEAGAEPEAAIRRLLSLPGVDYIEVRNSVAGCFDFHVFPVQAFPVKEGC